MSGSFAIGAPIGILPIRHHMSRPCGNDACFAQPTVGVDARVHEVDELSDLLRGAGARENVNTAAIDLAGGCQRPSRCWWTSAARRERQTEPCACFVDVEKVAISWRDRAIEP